MDKNGIVPKGFKVTEEKEIPWYEREGIDSQKLDAQQDDYKMHNQALSTIEQTEI